MAQSSLGGPRIVLAVVFALVVIGATVANYAITSHQVRPVKERVVRIETREKVNACVDGKPRPCRALLNRLLHFASAHQKREIHKAALQRRAELSSPKVAVGSPPRAPSKTPSEPPRSPSPSQPAPQPSNPPSTSTTPLPIPSPTPSPAPTPDPGVPPDVRQKVCEIVNQLIPVCE